MKLLVLLYELEPRRVECDEKEDDTPSGKRQAENSEIPSAPLCPFVFIIHSLNEEYTRLIYTMASAVKTPI